MEKILAEYYVLLSEYRIWYVELCVDERGLVQSRGRPQLHVQHRNWSRGGAHRVLRPIHRVYEHELWRTELEESVNAA